jgi:hypothetical protein
MAAATDFDVTRKTSILIVHENEFMARALSCVREHKNEEHFAIICLLSSHPYHVQVHKYKEIVQMRVLRHESAIRAFCGRGINKTLY